MDCTTPGFPAQHTFPELAQTHVHRVGEAIQPSHPLSSPSIFPSIRVFSKESILRIRWPKYWSFSFSISSSNEYSGLIFFGWTGWISLLSKGLSRVSSNTTVQKHQFLYLNVSNHLILCRPLLLLPLIFPSIKVFSNESALHIRWPKYWSFSFSISPSNE